MTLRELLIKELIAAKSLVSLSQMSLIIQGLKVAKSLAILSSSIISDTLRLSVHGLISGGN